jgi:hypothetical protein
VVAGIGHIDIARAVGGDADWQIKARRRPSAIDGTHVPHVSNKKRKNRDRRGSASTRTAGNEQREYPQAESENNLEPCPSRA